MKIGRILEPAPEWQHPDPEVRYQALQDRLPAGELLAQLARDDTDPRVRALAAANLDDTDLLANLSEDENQDVASAAGRRWVSSCINTASGDTATLLSQVPCQTLLAFVASYADPVDLRLASIPLLKDEALLTQVLERDNHTSVHQACADRICDEETLEHLARQFRGKDKQVNRILRQKLDDIRGARERAMAVQDRCTHLKASFDQLAHDKYPDQAERRYNLLNDTWQELLSEHRDEIDEIALANIEAARMECATVIAELATKREHQDTLARQAVQRLEEVTRQLEVGPEPLASLGELLDDIRGSWPVGLADDHELTRHYYELIGPLENLAAQYALVVGLPGEDASRSQLKSAVAKISWPEQWPTPMKLNQARERLVALEEAESRRHARREQEAAQITEQLNRLEQSIADGKLKPANRLHNTLRKRFDTKDANVSRTQKEHLARLAQKLHELQDWQGFVTLPKRIDLCESMEALRDDAGIPPPEKARAIKDLQEQWKALGASNHHQSQQLWGRFKHAADVAFEPCAAYFAKQREVRAQNLEERNRLCEQLENLHSQTDWDQADYKALNEEFVRIRRAWREYDDVPHAQRKKVQGRFSKAIKHLEPRLAGEQARNHAIKESLVARVRELLEQEEKDLGTLITETKKAQQEWKQVGITDRKADQRLWKAFREQCDLVFSKRDEESQRQKASINEARSAARDINRKLKELVQSNDIDRGQLRQIRSEFDAVAPGNDSDDVKKEFRRQIKQAEKAIEQRARASRREMMDEIRRKSGICLRLEKGEITSEAAETEWQSEVEIDSDLLQRLEDRRLAAVNPNPQALEENQAAAELLCVRIEILAELPSPPDAQTLRMQYQVERLNRELSRGQKDTRSPQQQLDDLLLEWYSLGALPDTADALRLRFQQAEEKLAV